MIRLLCLLLLTLPALADGPCAPLKLRPAGPAPGGERKALLWQITPAGGNPSLLFGTIHLGDPEITDLPGPVEEGLKRSGTFVMEALPTPPELERFQQRLFFQDGRSLEDYLPPPLHPRALRYLGDYGLPPEQASRLKPWAAFLMLAGAPAGNGPPLDMVLLYRAREAGLSVAGLETLEEQAGVLEGLSVEDQKELLRDTVCHFDRIRADQEALKRLYLQRDLTGLARYADRYVSDSGSYDRLERLLLTGRNLRMAARMEDYLRRGGAFIAVGAMHLPGERGLLRLLEQAGYRVEPLY